MATNAIVIIAELLHCDMKLICRCFYFTGILNTGFFALKAYLLHHM